MKPICLFIFLISICSCGNFFIEEFPQMSYSFTTIGKDSIFTFSNINTRNWDVAYVIRADKWDNSIENIKMSSKVKKHIKHVVTQTNKSVMIFTYENELTLFAAVDESLANFSSLQKNKIYKTDLFIMGINKNIELIKPDIFNIFNATKLVTTDIHQTRKAL